MGTEQQGLYNFFKISVTCLQMVCRSSRKLKNSGVASILLMVQEVCMMNIGYIIFLFAKSKIFKFYLQLFVEFCKINNGTFLLSNKVPVSEKIYCTFPTFFNLSTEWASELQNSETIKKK